MSALTRAASLRTAFLQDAAKSMATTSPSTASYLASESIQYGLLNESQTKALTDKERQTFCTACGNVFIPGLNCSISRGDKVSASNKLKTPQRRSIVYYCQRCHHYTPFRLLSPERPAFNKRKKGIATNAVSKQEVLTGPPSEQLKKSSKQRAKARKDRAGLQSLLKKSKEEKTSSPQLSLMDLMRP